LNRCLFGDEQRRIHQYWTSGI